MSVAALKTPLPSLTASGFQTIYQNNIPATAWPFEATAALQGILPNGEVFQWSMLDAESIPAILVLQDHVASAATGIEKTFLIKRSAEDYGYSLTQNHHYWGAWIGEELVALFGLADNDEEVGDGRGEKTPKEILGVADYTHVSILKGAQVHPNYREQGLAAIGALSRYLFFIQNPQKRVMMTKIHAGNTPVAQNYLNNSFIEAWRTSVTDRGETFDVMTFTAERQVLDRWLHDKAANVIAKYKLQTI